MPRTYVFKFLNLILVAFILAVGTPEAAAADDLKYKVAAILPLSGSQASLGYAVMRGMEMALEELDPPVRARLAISFEDDQCAPKITAAAAQNLIARDKPDLFLSTSAQPGMVLAPIAEAQQIPLLSISLPPEIVAGRRYAFLFFARPEELVSELIGEAVRRNYKKVARISAVHDGRLAMKYEFDRQNSGRLKVVLDEEYSVDVMDFRSYLSKVRSSGAIDGIYVNLFVSQIGIFAKQARESGVDLPLFTTEFFENPDQVKASNGALIGQWYITQAEGLGGFREKFIKRFPDAATLGAVNGHDAILLLAAALKKNVSPAGLRDYLAAVQNFQGAIGTISVSADRRFVMPVAVKVVN